MVACFALPILSLHGALLARAAELAEKKPSPAAAVSRRVDELLAEALEAGRRRTGGGGRRCRTGAAAVSGPDRHRAHGLGVRAYLADSRPEKTAELVDRLLASPAHATHLANVWRELMLPRKFDPQQAAGLVGLQNWLRRQFVANRRYDRVVADLLVATGGDESGPALFYTAVGLKPEELGTTTARIFLGIRLDCAQCHDHPFDRWTQQDFWGYAAFFARVEQRARNAATMRLVDTDSGEVRLPGSDTIVGPRYPGGVDTRAGEAGTRRQQLAIWIVSGENPYLARATVNLVWAQLFGRGLVEPLDDFGSHNPASHPELLETLSEAFIASGYNLAELYRTLANTRAYQLASRSPSGSSPPAELFAQMSVKTLTSEQLFDSLQRVAMRSPQRNRGAAGRPAAAGISGEDANTDPHADRLRAERAAGLGDDERAELSEIADPSSSRLAGGARRAVSR